jgi:1-deoxy-D-xylulose-5-phosphate synthase
VLFEELGVRYFGPIDGHDISMLVNTLSKVIKINEPKLIHVITKKGKGYKYAEESPTVFHGAGPFDIETGNHNGKHSESYSDVMGKKITELARTNDKIAVVSAAMVGGTGLEEFARQFPGRTFDVGIAEEHAVTFAGALARGGLKPIVAIYSTFLQRGYDQIIHDVALQNLPVVFFVEKGRHRRGRRTYPSRCF